MSLTEIARLFDCQPSTISHWASEGHDGVHWRKIRDEKLKQELAKLSIDVGSDLKEVAQRSLSLLKRNLSMLDRSEVVLSLRDLDTISSILGNVDKMLRLEAGKPTAINETIKVSHAKVMETINKLREVDPYATYPSEDDEPEVH